MSRNFFFIVLFTMIRIPGFSQSGAQAEEFAVINDTFLKVIGTGDYYMPPPDVPIAPFHPDSLDLILDEEEPSLDGEKDSLAIQKRDSLRARELKEYEEYDWENYHKKLREFKAYFKKLPDVPFDTANLIVIVHDSLFDYPDGELSYRLTKEGFKANFEVDESFRIPAIKVVDSLNQTVGFPLSAIIKTGRYNLVKSENYSKAKNDRIIGVVRISRVAFNGQKKRACFIFTIFCGGECGGGEIVFVEKVKGNWMVVKKQLLWVS